MASTKVLRVVSDELTEVLGLDEGRIAAKLPALSGLKGKPLADALLAEAADIYTTDTISEESVKVLKTLGWAGPKEPPVEDGDDENKSNLPLPDVATMDHDDLLEELEHSGATIPKALRKESTKTMAKLQILVEAARPVTCLEPVIGKKETVKKEKTAKKEAVKKEKTAKKETTKKASAVKKDEYGCSLRGASYKFIEALKAAGDKGMTMKEAQDLKWNETRATFNYPWGKIVAAGHGRKEGTRMFYSEEVIKSK